MRHLTEVSPSWFYWEQDRNFRFTLITGSELEKSSLDPRPLVGRTLWELDATPIKDNGSWENHKAALRSHRAFSDFVFKYPATNGGLRFIATSGQPQFDDAGRFAGYQGIAKDVTKRTWRERRLVIEQNVAHILAEAQDTDEAISRTIRTICETIEWGCGARWELDDENKTLRCADTWGLDVPAVQRFLAASRGLVPMTVSAGGLIRRVCASGTPFWVQDVANDKSFLRAPEALRAGLRSAFAFPIRIGNRIVGAMEFFAHEIYEPDVELLNCTAQVGSGIGQFLQRVRAEHGLRQFQAAMDASLDVIFLIEPATLRFVYVNERACRLSGYSREEMMNLPTAAVISGMNDDALRRLFAEVIAKGAEGLTSESLYRDRHGNRRGWFESHRRALRMGEKWLIVTVAREITERKSAERAIRRAGRMYATLSATNEAILHSRSPEELYERVCEAAVADGKFVTAAILMPDPRTARVFPVGVAGKRADIVRRTHISVDPAIPQGRGLVGTAFRTSKPCISNDYRNDPISLPWRDGFDGETPAALAAVPLIRGGRTIGALLFSDAERNAFDDASVQLMERMAQNISFALENFERDAERLRAERARQESEEKYRNVLANMSEGYFEVDLSGSYTFFNDAMRRMHGLTAEEMVGLNYRDYCDPETALYVFTVYNKVFRTGQPIDLVEWRFIRKDGTRGVWAQSVQLITGPEGKPAGFRGVTRDVTGRRQAEEALRASEQKHRAILETMYEGYFEVDLKGNYTFFNDAMCRIHRCTREELVGVNFRSYALDEATIKYVYHIYNEIYRTGAPAQLTEWQFVRNDGTHGIWESSVQLITDGNSKPIGFRGVVRDITERRQSEAALRESEEKYRTILESIEDAYYEVDLKGNLVFFNSAFCRLLGRTEAELRGLNNRQYQSAEIAANVYKTFNEVYRTGVPARAYDWELLREDGSKVSVEGSVNLVRDDNGRPIGFRGMLRDVSERREMEVALRASEMRFRALTNLSSDWYWEQDTDYRFNRVESGSEDSEPARAYLVGKRPWETGYEIEGPGGWSAYRQLLNTRKSFRDVVMCRRLPDGSTRYISVSGEPIFAGDGRFEGYRGVTREITAQKLAEERVQYLATHDGLTDLPNRFMFGQWLTHALESAKRYQRKFAVLFIDLDRFKIINDTLGHAAGDAMLKEMSVRLKECLRGSDVVARFGGDEFVVLLHEANEAQHITAVAHKLLATVTRPLSISGQECRVSASIGISTYPEDGGDEETLMKNADIAMYLAKEEGKNNFQFFQRNRKVQSLERLTLEANLRRALERNELSLHYQPQVDLKTGSVVGVEALLRWHNPALGNVSPTQFIPVAEEIGMIVPIGRWVLQTACAQSIAWQRQGLPPVRMAVNLSARQFTDQGLLGDIKTALTGSGLAPSLLELEITEGVVMQNAERATQILFAIKDLGVRLAIDDFGTGYSSLAQIKRYPIDTLKVDRSFIRDIPQDAEDKVITEAIIAMGKALGLTIVAEGVETAPQAEFLRAHGCDQMQGYHYSKPVVAEKFSELLRRTTAAESTRKRSLHGS